MNDNMERFNGKRYFSFGSYLKSKFGVRVYKISVDAGFSCPNRDGTLSSGGCIFCDNASFRVRASKNTAGISGQLHANANAMRERYRARAFIAYFQHFTNTYASFDTLKSYYEEALQLNGVLGLAIGTRPDCVTSELLDYLNELGENYHIWLEYGVQTVNNNTLRKINRGHDFECFLETYRRTRQRKNIHICAHIIHGLPGETKSDMLNTVKTLSDLKIDALKIHQLHVVRNTELERQYQEGKILLPALEEYLDWMASSLEIISPEIIIQRLFGLSDPGILVAPQWGLRKNEIARIIDDYLEQRNTYQGRLYYER